MQCNVKSYPLWFQSKLSLQSTATGGGNPGSCLLSLNFMRKTEAFEQLFAVLVLSGAKENHRTIRAFDSNQRGKEALLRLLIADDDCQR